MSDIIQNPDTAIIVDNVEKSYKVYLDKGKTLKERVIFAKRRKYDNRQILKGISFEIGRGQVVGLIGKNGCGKSTTLKLLTKILKPTSGTVTVRGRVSSLIELGAGFHPDMSGRENIYINASIFGLQKKEIDERMDDIISFSELEDFIDQPVRTYSSGMYMRLAFAVAINVNADVLLIDEILAVGDINFQKKCYAKLEEIKQAGTTIVIVSHSMDQLLSICTRLIWIEDGHIREDGAPNIISMHYLDSMEDERIKRLAEESKVKFADQTDEYSIGQLTDYVHPEARRDGSHDVYYTNIMLYNEKGEPCQIFNSGEKAVLVCKFNTKTPGLKVNINMDIVKDNWQYQYGSCYAAPGDELAVINGPGEYRFTIDSMRLLPGKYYIDAGINGEDGSLYDHVRNILQFTIRDFYNNEFGPCVFDHHWEVIHYDEKKS